MKKLLLFFLIVVIPGEALPAAMRTATARDAEGRLPKHTVLPPLQTESYEFYELCGCCEKDLLFEMTGKAMTWKDGTKYDSITSWKVKWDYAHNKDSGACYADSFRVTVDILFRLPRWTCSNPESPALTARWASYIENLVAHERGHRDRTLAAASDLTRAVADMPPAGNCSDLDRQLEELSRERMKRLDEEQDRYDAATDHGHVYGLAFP